MKKIFKIIGAFVGLILLISVICLALIFSKSTDRTAENSTDIKTILVLGSRINQNKKPAKITQERLDAALLLAKNNPQATKIFYTYDSAVEYPKFLKLYPYFDKVFTFEPEDAKKYNLHFRPLFYLKEYRSLQSNSKPQYDISFIGTAHTDRYLIGEKVAEISEKQKLSSFFYYFLPPLTGF